MIARRVALALLIASASFANAATKDPDPLDAVSFLAGSWHEVSADGTYEEVWLAPRGGTMIGMSRMVRGPATVGWEHLRIELDGITPVYVAFPSGQAETRFPLVETAPGLAAFANPAHDFPQRITYRKVGRSLVVKVSGPGDGGPRTLTFLLTRAR